jgi:hypothetical protein
MTSWSQCLLLKSAYLIALLPSAVRSFLEALCTSVNLNSALQDVSDHFICTLQFSSSAFTFWASKFCYAFSFRNCEVDICCNSIFEFILIVQGLIWYSFVCKFYWNFHLAQFPKGSLDFIILWRICTMQDAPYPASCDVTEQASPGNNCCYASGKHDVAKQRLLGKAYNTESGTFSICPAEGL